VLLMLLPTLFTILQVYFPEFSSLILRKLKTLEFVFELISKFSDDCIRLSL
jgi:hypothetical protein